jgi:Leucine-rich repeat (LRR) protein
MKNIIKIIVLLFVVNTVNGQIVSIPDEAFKVKLISLGIDTNLDGEIQQSEALAITTLDVSSSNILYLDGIEAFTNLTSLNCKFNFIKTINVSALVNLISFDISYCQIKNININILTNLQSFKCTYNKLTNLNVSGLINLKSLSCSINQLTSLNVTGLNNLETLDFSHNPLPSISAVTGITNNLKELSCNGLQLTSLNVTQYPNLKSLYCVQNSFTSFSNIIGLTNNLENLCLFLNQTTVVDLSPYTNLKLVQCEGQLGGLTLNGLVNLETLICRNSQLTSLNLNGLTGLKKLYLNDNQITSLDLSSCPNIQNLYAHGNPLTLNFGQMVNTQNLVCNYNQLASQDFSTLTQLQSLIIYGTSGTSTLNLSGLSNLKKLNCYGQGLSSINLNGLTSLEELVCGGNQLTSLNLSGLGNLKLLSCRENLLTSLNLTGLNNLEHLDFASNSISSINLSGLTNLKYLFCDSNQLTSLDSTNLDNLRNLTCNTNQITSLNLSNSQYLSYLNCSGNNMNSLILSNEHFNLRDLNYGQNPLLNFNFSIYNQLTALRIGSTGTNSIDVFNLTKLNLLWCNDNAIPAIDVSNNYNLEELYCGSSALSNLFMKNGSNENFGIAPSPNLQFVCTDDTETLSVQTIINNSGNTSCVVNSYCSFFPGGNYNTISGYMLFDSNNNGCDATDLPQPNIRIDINDGTNQGATYSNSLGNYNFFTQAGSFDITPNVENPTWFTFSPSSATIPFSNNLNNTSTQNFCISAIGVHPDLEVVLAPITPARPGFDATYRIVYKNKGNQTLSGGVNVTFDDDKTDFVSATPTVDTQSTNSLSWNYTNLMPFESRTIAFNLNINSPVETPAVNIGDILNFVTTINPVTDDIPADNTFNYNQTVVGSYDPNSIECLEGVSVDPSYIGQYLHYGVNFENTGNYPAENIVVKVIIDTTKYDMNSLQLMDTSHNSYTRITGNVAEFIFETINLDSGGHGNILFKIKTLNNLSTGDMVNKRADIFFDYNAPVDTGLVNTIFQSLNNGSFEIDKSISIYPNPASSNVNINSNNTIKSVELFDIQGRLLQTQLIDKNQTSIDISEKSNGVYFLKITSEKGSKVEKLVKE